MFWKRSIIIMALLTLGLLLVACQIPLPGGGGEEVLLPPTTAETTDPTATIAPAEGTTAEQPTPETTTGGETAEGGETPATTGEETSPRPETETAETPAEQPATTETTTGGETAPVTTTEEQPATTTPAETPAETTAETPATTTPETPATTTTEQPTTTTTTNTGTHTVVAGENLYRIGLQYGVSWVVLAQYNNLPNANSLVVGQVLRIPTVVPDTTATPTPVPVPSDGTTYTVQAGDTLAKIGQTYGIDWRLIAEANGIINPNRILVGDELKIPSNTPGAVPELTHEVKAGETLFLISLNYGITWTRIAEANELTTPYVIYPGQILTIPGE